MLRLLTAALSCAGLLLAAAPAPDRQQEAKKYFEAECALCHGPDGRGLKSSARMYRVPLAKLDLAQGPAAQSPEPDIVKIISEGKGKMDPYKKKLTPEEIEAMARYVISLRANAKKN